MQKANNKTNDDQAALTPREARLAYKRSNLKRIWLYRAALLSFFFIAVTLIFAFQSRLAPSIDLTELTQAKKTASTPDSDKKSVRDGKFDLDGDRLFEIESLLKKLKIDPGAVDGVIDQETTTAIALFEKIIGKPITGRPSLPLLTLLRETLHKLSGTPEDPIEDLDNEF